MGPKRGNVERLGAQRADELPRKAGKYLLLEMERVCALRLRGAEFEILAAHRRLDGVALPAADMVDRDALRKFIKLIVFDDSGMREKDFASISNRLRRIFASSAFAQRLSSARANWIQIEPKTATECIINFLESI